MKREEDKWRRFAKDIGLPRIAQELVRQAFSHPSYVREQGLAAQQSNQRLEFLGDGVLDLIIAEDLYHRHAEAAEGGLTRRKAALVRQTTLARVARGLRLGELLLLGRGEEDTGGREKDSLLADALEALVGAIYLARGYKAAQKFVLEQFGELLAGPEDYADFDYKTQLQELVQSLTKRLPVYEPVHMSGPPHQRVFETRVVFGGQVLGEGAGSSKRAAEQDAARAALERQREWLPLQGGRGEEPNGSLPEN